VPGPVLKTKKTGGTVPGPVSGDGGRRVLGPPPPLSKVLYTV